MLERTRAAVNRLFDSFEEKRVPSKWAELAICSQDTAIGDIDDPVKRDVLVKEPGGGCSIKVMPGERRTDGLLPSFGGLKNLI